MENPRTIRDLGILLDNYKLDARETTVLRLGHVIALYRSKNNPKFYEFLANFYGNQWSDSLKKPALTAVRKLSEKLRKFSNNIHKEGPSTRIVQLLQQEYTLPGSNKRPHSDVEPSQPFESECPAKRLTIEPPSAVELLDTLAPETPPLTPNDPQSDILGPPAPDTLPPSSMFDHITQERSCSECRVMRHELSGLKKELSSSRNETAKLQSRVDVKFKKAPRVLGQANKRLKAQLERQQETHDKQSFELQFEFLELQEDFIELDSKYNEKVDRVEQLVEDVDHLNNQVAKLAKQKSEIRRYHNAVKKQSVLSSQLKSAKEEIKALKSQLAFTENLLPEHDKENTLNTIDGKQFDARTRKCILFCLEKNVSQQNASSIVQFIVQEMTGKRVPKVPKRSTVQNIAREGGILANIQTGQIMSESSNVTIAWDATTKKGLHVNEIHVITPYGSFVLDVSQLPGGRAPDYATHVKEILADIADQYSACHNKNPDDVKKQIHDGEYIFIMHICT